MQLVIVAGPDAGMVFAVTRDRSWRTGRDASDIVQQTAVRLKHLEGRSLAEIAESMNKSEAAVAGLLRRGIAALKRSLGNSESSAIV